MPTPHVHAELIKAWADGAEIEYRLSNGTWSTCAFNTPAWAHHQQYRIKQVAKPKVTRWLWAYKFPQDLTWKQTASFLTETEAQEWTSAKLLKLEWSAMEFDE